MNVTLCTSKIDIIQSTYYGPTVVLCFQAKPSNLRFDEFNYINLIQIAYPLIICFKHKENYNDDPINQTISNFFKSQNRISEMPSQAFKFSKIDLSRRASPPPGPPARALPWTYRGPTWPPDPLRVIHACGAQKIGSRFALVYLFKTCAYVVQCPAGALV